jgi:hypothetical protein
VAKKKRVSHDQKRKAKLAKRASRAPLHEDLAYRGKKYQTEELVPVFFRTEQSIYEAFVMTERRLTDRAVEAAVVSLIRALRAGLLPPLPDTDAIHLDQLSDEELVTENIRRGWQDRFQTQPRPSVDKLVGVLRTTLGSIDVWKTAGPESGGYLNYLEGFLNKMGVSVEMRPADDEGDEPPEEDELLDLGRAWCHDGDLEAAADFRRLAAEWVRTGRAERVAEVCQRLLGESSDNPRVVPELSAMSIQAQQHFLPGG